MFAGLIALVTVAAVVGVLLGVAALAGTRVLGLTGGSALEEGEVSEGETLFLPQPRPTQGSGEAAAQSQPRQEGAQRREKQPGKPRPPIELVAEQDQVGSFEEIELTGSYPGGVGSILQVQRRQNGPWEEFPVDISVREPDFSTTVQTSRSGVNEFRVVDTDNGKASNAVRVRVG